MTTIKTYKPTKESFETYCNMQLVASSTGLSIAEIAEANDCSCGYELMKKMQNEGY